MSAWLSRCYSWAYSCPPLFPQLYVPHVSLVHSHLGKMRKTRKSHRPPGSGASASRPPGLQPDLEATRQRMALQQQLLTQLAHHERGLQDMLHRFMAPSSAAAAGGGGGGGGGAGSVSALAAASDHTLQVGEAVCVRQSR